MKYKKITWNDLAVEAGLSIFTPAGGAKEYHAMMQHTNTALNAEEQFCEIKRAMELLSNELKNTSLVFVRYFVSDAINQASFVTDDSMAAVSIVQQPPMNRTKVAAWLYFVEDCSVSTSLHGTVKMERSVYNHLFTMQMHNRQKNETVETYKIFDDYTEELTRHNSTLKDNCIRTWIYVYGVDIHYERMVSARKAYFEKEGLTDKTHYIASTGIEGKYIYPDSIVLMDAYAVEGIEPGQITYLKGLSHLNPTIEYGVTFERATAVDYGDRRHIFISGTASINNKGEIVHPLCIEKQIDRTLENIRVLLSEGQATMNDIAQMIIYLRDTADYDLVNAYMNENYPDTPKVIVWAPVCRPGWLIEIECIAVTDKGNKKFEVF